MASIQRSYGPISGPLSHLGISGATTPRFAKRKPIPKTMNQMPLIGGSGTSIVNEVMNARNLNTGFKHEELDETGQGAYSTNRFMNGVAKNAGKQKKHIFG